MKSFILRCLAGFLLLGAGGGELRSKTVFLLRSLLADLFSSSSARAVDLRNGGRFVTYYTEGPPGSLPEVADLQGFNALFIGVRFLFLHLRFKSEKK